MLCVCIQLLINRRIKSNKRATKWTLNGRLRSLLLEPRKGLSQLMQIRGNFSGNMVCTMLNGIRNDCLITFPSSSLSDLKGTQVISRRAEKLMPAGFHYKSSLKSSKHQSGAFFTPFLLTWQSSGFCAVLESPGLSH